MKAWLTAILINFSAVAFATTPHLYVTELGGDAVSIIDVTADTVQKIFGFSKPHVVRVTYDGTAAYVGDTNNNIYKITCIEHTVSQIGTLSGHPVAFCILPDASYLYAATHDNNLVIIDLTTDQIVKQLPGLNGPQDIRSTPDGQYVYVTNKGNGTVSVFRTSDNILYQTITGFATPVGLTFDVNGNFAYISDNAENAVYVLNLSTNTIVDKILGFSSPRYIAMAPKKTVAYISNGGNDTVSILRIADNFVIGTIPVPSPGAIGVSYDGQYLYVASDYNQVFKINTLDNSIDLVIPNFNQPSNLSFTDNNAPHDTVNGWQVVTDPSNPYNQITWEQPAGSPHQYRIFTDEYYEKLLATIPATSELLYNDYNRELGQTYSYYVIADYPNGFSSTIGSIDIPTWRIGLPR